MITSADGQNHGSSQNSPIETARLDAPHALVSAVSRHDADIGEGHGVGDPVRDGLLAVITDQSTWRALRAEREFLRLLKAGCHTPIGLLTTEAEGHMTMTAIIFPEQPLATTSPLTAHTTGSAHSPETVAAALFHALA